MPHVTSNNTLTINVSYNVPQPVLVRQTLQSGGVVLSCATTRAKGTMHMSVTVPPATTGRALHSPLAALTACTLDSQEVATWLCAAALATGDFEPLRLACLATGACNAMTSLEMSYAISLSGIGGVPLAQRHAYVAHILMPAGGATCAVAREEWPLDEYGDVDRDRVREVVRDHLRVKYERLRAEGGVEALLRKVMIAWLLGIDLRTTSCPQPGIAPGFAAALHSAGTVTARTVAGAVGGATP